LHDQPLPVTGNTEKTAPENRAFYPALDGLRAIAFLMVFFQHYLAVPWGWTGVNVFFVLSGFLITGILDDTRDQPHRARNFYLRRTLRIFPLYYGIFLALLLLTPLMHWRWTWLWLAWPLYLGNFLRFLGPSAGKVNSPLELATDAHLHSPMLPKGEPLYLGHFWSLCVEEQFYLVWPWVVFWIRSRKALLWICGLTVVIVPIVRSIPLTYVPVWMRSAELTYRFTPFQLDSLLLGGLLALLWRGSHRHILLRIAPWVAVIGIVVAVFYISIGLRAVHGDFDIYPYPPWKQTWGLTYINFLTAAVILCCLRPNTISSRLLSLRPLRSLGRISYGAYVFHDIFHNLYVHIVTKAHIRLFYGEEQVWRALLALACTWAIAALSFRYFETPFLNLKERLTVRS
jgi:peptidoglycan/LPS O-acetylase OafA/YrhL